MDTLATFGRTLEFLIENKLSFLKMFTPCPYPGTKYHTDLKAAGRILSDDLRRYDYGSPLISPLYMTTSQMMDGFRDVYSSFYSLGAIARRLLPPPRSNWLETAAYAVANVKVNRFLRRNPDAWGTIS